MNKNIRVFDRLSPFLKSNIVSFIHLS